MKRKCKIILFSLLVLALCTGTALAAEQQAKPTHSVVYVNGIQVEFEAYTIGGSNYFKLRDLAMALKDTNKEFSVGYDNGVVSLNTKGTYTPVGGELSAGNGQAKPAINVQSSFQFYGEGKQDDYPIALSAYNIGGNNFVKLRDLMQWLNVGVGYDAKTAAITVTTHQNYELPKVNGNPLINAHAIESKTRSKYGNLPGNIMQGGMVLQYGNYYFVSNGYDGIYRYSADGKDVKKLPIDEHWISGNLQGYNNKLYFEATRASSGTMRALFSMNLDGSGRKTVLTGTVDEATPHNYIIYNGLIYARTFETDGSQHIVSVKPDGSGKKVIYDGSMVVGGAMGREYDGFNNFYIRNDRIYFLKTDQPKDYTSVKLVSINMTGGDMKTHAAFSGYTKLLEVNDTYAFYQQSTRVYRINLNGSNNICIYTGSQQRDDMVFYGDKVLYETSDFYVGIMNSDGTEKSLFPNGPMQGAQGVSLGVVNDQYLYCEYIAETNGDRSYGKALLRSSSQTPGYITVEGVSNTPVWKVSNSPFPEIARSPQGYSYAAPEDGTYTIKPYLESGKAWAIGAASIKDGEKVILWDGTGKENQTFQITTVKNQSTIKAVHSGKNLSAGMEKGSALTQSGDSTQAFFFVDAGNSSVYIMTEYGYYLCLSQGKYDNGTSLISWTKTAEESQRFRLSKAEVVEKEEPKVDTADIKSGTYYIASKKSPSKMLDISGASKKDGAKVILWDLTAEENQQFIFTIDGKKCTIQAKHSGKALIAPSEKGGELTQSGTLPPTTFYLVDAGDGAVNLMTEDGLYVGVSGGKLENGSKLITWTKASDSSQAFVLKAPFGQ